MARAREQGGQDLTGIRELGVNPWRLQPGAQNSLCDVHGVSIGHKTVISDDPVTARTGVSVILPGPASPQVRIPAAGYVMNGTGELTGLHQINEWGALETPIALTGTAGVAAAMEGLMSYLLEISPEIGRLQAPPLPVVGECNDMYLNDSRARPLQPDHVLEAIRLASGTQDAWGAVGGGTGMTCFGFKSGIGSASRLVEVDKEVFTLGVCTMANFGQPGDLVIGGVAMGHLPGEIVRGRKPPLGTPEGSMISVIGTDAPLDALGLLRVARRGPFGMGRVGSYGRHGSGDIFLAFSVRNAEDDGDDSSFATRRVVRQDALNPFFLAASEGVEESILNALVAAGEMKGRDGHKVEAVPWDVVLQRLEERGKVHGA